LRVRAFRDISLGRKLMLIMMLTSSTVLVLACLVVVTFDLVSLRQTMARDLATQATVLGDNSTAALSFGDAAGAAEVLGVLRGQPNITAAFVYTRHGKTFAKYLRPGVKPDLMPMLPEAEGSYFRQDRLVNYQRITLAGEAIGAIYMESDLDEMNQRLRHYAGIIVLVVLSSSLVAFLLASKLQRLITGPILELVRTAKLISGEKNYQLRARSYGADELGLLVSGFNEMLEQIQHRDQELERQHSDLQKEVAARTAINQQLETAKEAAEAASNAKGEFLANMSHEIRTPINGILGMTELVLDTELTHDQRDCLTMARSSGESLLGLINDILDFSKVESGRLELDPIEFNLYNCVGETMKALALRAHQKGLELAYDVSPEVPAELVGDPGRLRQILVNLVGNAIKFTEHGEVLMKVENFRRNGHAELLFKVTDTGIGIPVEKQPLLFQAFSQADSSITRRYGGTGLGLAISRRLVEMMGGRLWLESREGQGSTFQFTAHFSQPPVSARSPSPLPESDLRDVSVLIVDDNETNRRILCGLTSGWGMIPTAVKSGHAALEIINERQQEPFRVILIDACMPIMDGFQLTEKLKTQYSSSMSRSMILMLTSAGRPGEAALCKQLGISAYLLKPVMKADLQAAILTVLGHPGAGAAPSLVTRHSLRESSRKLRILVAEDNAVNQALVVRVLAKLGHASVLVGNGLEALALATSEKFDLVLMDVQMPEMDGLSATTAIRESEKGTGGHLPIIAMTAHAMSGDRERCLEAGMDNYLAKPVRFSDIEAAINNVAQPGSGAPTPAAQPSGPAASPAADAGPVAPPCWNRAEALDRLDGDEELLHELCVIYLKESPNLLQQLRHALAQGDSKAMNRAAHSLKGEVSYLSAARATQAARRLEDLGRDGDLSQAPEAIAGLERELETLRSTIQEFAGVPQ
jgi:two-component system, sensor histidine kinase and response regulator